MFNYDYEPLPIASPSSGIVYPRRHVYTRFHSTAIKLFMAATAFLLVLYAYLELRLRSTGPLIASADLTRLVADAQCRPATTTVFAAIETTLPKMERPDPPPPPVQPQAPEASTSTATSYSTADYVIGAPTRSFKDNLRQDQKYLLSFLDAGWTNDIITISNSIYLAMITSRVPIIPPFPPNGDHMSWEEQSLLFSDVFDLQDFQERVGIPMVEWKDLKEGTDEEHLGCWSPWLITTNQAPPVPRGSKLHELFGLDVAFTATPESTKLGWTGSLHSGLWQLAQLAYPQGRKQALSQHPEVRPSRNRGVTLEPDEHVVCYDYLYYTAVANPMEWEYDYSPVWRFVGTHLRFRNNIIHKAKAYIRKAIGISEDDSIPPFISLHIRHSDFARMCDDLPLDQCYRPISAWARDVAEIRQRLLEKKGIDVSTVIITSDETSPEWWNEIKQQGWHFADHLAVVAENPYGPWLSIIIDSCVQSLGIGFVGTFGSTMSLVSQRRVEEWNGGIGMMSKWGGWGMETDF